MLGCKRQEEQRLCRRGARDERHRGPLSRRRATTMGPCRWRWALVGAKEQQATSDQATGNQATSNRRGQGMARQGRVEQGRAGHVEPGMATSRAGPPGRASARATRTHLQCGQVCARRCARPWAGQSRARQGRAGQSRAGVFASSGQGEQASGAGSGPSRTQHTHRRRPRPEAGTRTLHDCITRGVQLCGHTHAHRPHCSRARARRLHPPLGHGHGNSCITWPCPI